MLSNGRSVLFSDRAAPASVAASNSGVWIYNFEAQLYAKLFNYPFYVCSSSPAMDQVALHGWWEGVWVAKIDLEDYFARAGEFREEWLQKQGSTIPRSKDDSREATDTDIAVSLQESFTRRSHEFWQLERFDDYEHYLLKAWEDEKIRQIFPLSTQVEIASGLRNVYILIPDQRDIVKAIDYATKACELTEYKDASALSQLADTYSEANKFDLAVEWQKKAIECLKNDEDEKAYSDRLTVYERKLKSDGKLRGTGGLIAHWEFSNDNQTAILDSTGNELYGQLRGDATVIPNPERGAVLSLDGEEDWIDCGQNEQFNLTAEVTIAAWIKVESFDKTCQSMLTKGNTAWRLQRYQHFDVIEFACSGVRVTGPLSEYGTVCGSTSVNDGRWHHVVGAYDGRSISLYLDGILDRSRIASGGIARNSYSVVIGANSETAESETDPREWNGLIDDVRIYAYGLNAEEIRNLYEGKNIDVINREK